MEDNEDTTTGEAGATCHAAKEDAIKTLVTELKELFHDTAAERQQWRQEHIEQQTWLQGKLEEDQLELRRTLKEMKEGIDRTVTARLAEFERGKEDSLNSKGNATTQQKGNMPRESRFQPELSVINSFQSSGHRYNRQPQMSESSQYSFSQSPLVQGGTSTPTAPRGGSFRSFSSNRSVFEDVPRPKLAEFDGREDWEVFFYPFERMARRYQWNEEEKLERLHDCMRKGAVKFICTLPLAIQDDYATLVQHLADRFGRSEPPSTLRKQLSEFRQGKETIEEYAQEVRRLAAKAFPGVQLQMLEELAAEFFLKGLKDTKVAYEAMNQAPKTVSAAVEEVVRLQHNFKATIGRDSEKHSQSHVSRRVAFATDEDSEDETVIRRAYSPKPRTTNEKIRNFHSDKSIESRLEKIESLLLQIPNLLKTEQPRTDSSCYNCGEDGHFIRDCKKEKRRSRSNSPHHSNRKLEESPKIARVTIRRLHKTSKSIFIGVSVNGNKASALIDTGADATVISQELAAELGIKGSNEKAILCNAENGAEMEAVGGVTVTLSLANSSWDWPVYIAPIRDPILVGMDFLEEIDATILARQGDIIINGSVIPGICKDGFAPATVSLDEKVVIPARSEKVVIARVTGCNPSKESALFEPASLNKGIFAGAALVKGKGSVPIKILNPNTQEATLETGTHLGKLLDFEMAEEDSGSLQASNAKKDITLRACEIEQNTELEIPEHVADLIERASEHLQPNERPELEQLLVEYQDVFAKSDEDVGCFKDVKHTIPTGSARPIRQPVRRTPIGFQSEEEQHLKKLLDSGIVVPSTSEWASPVVLVRKKDGGLRWCIDYRKINDVSSKPSVAIPNIEECLNALQGVSLFSTLDLQMGYHQIQMTEEDQPKTAFNTRYGLFEFTRMPFGLCGAPGTFQRAMELVLSGLQWKQVLIYLDDVIVSGNSFKDHISRLQEVFKRFREYKLKLKPSKCHLFQRKVLFLGHMVSSEGIETNPKLVQTVSEWKTPRNGKEVQVFLGLTNYYRRFIPHYTEKAQPLYFLTQKGVTFQWSDEQQRAFRELQTSLMSAPVLAFPLEDGELILDTDASNYGIGAVLQQDQNQTERVLAYGSKKLTKEQERYCITRKELLAIVYFTNYFKYYLLGRKFTIRTDHNSLTWLFRFKSPQGQLARWLEELSQYTFTVQHREGKAHGNADALSRNPSILTCECYSAGTLKSLPCGGCKHCDKVTGAWEQFDSEVDYVVPLATRRVKRGTVEMEPFKNPWAGGYSCKELEVAQRNDPDLGRVHMWIDSTAPTRKEDLSLESQALKHYWLCRNQIERKEGVLYYRWEGAHENSKLLLIVPRRLKDEVLKSCHESPLSGHPGVTRTKERVRQFFFWHSLSADVEQFVTMCHTCQVKKKENRKIKAPLQEYQSGSPLDRVQLDILGPFPVSAKGNKYILVIMDQFTKWVEAFALPNQEAETVCKTFVEEFVTRYGAPIEVHTDQGRNFDSNLFKRVCILLDIAKTRTTPYHPSSNGLVERFNRTLLQMIRCYCSQDQSDWDAHLPYLTSAYRSTPHTATGLTPNKLMFGREVYGPEASVHRRVPEKDSDKPLPYLQHLQEVMTEDQDLVRKKLKDIQRKQKQTHDLRSTGKPYVLGDLVLVADSTKTVGRSPKLQALWKGPYVIIAVLGPVLYKVTDQKNQKILHFNRMKRYQSDNIPYWVARIRANIGSKNEEKLKTVNEESLEPQRHSEADSLLKDTTETLEPQRHSEADTYCARDETWPLVPQRHSEKKICGNHMDEVITDSPEPQRHSETTVPTEEAEDADEGVNTQDETTVDMSLFAASPDVLFSTKGRKIRKPRKLNL